MRRSRFALLVGAVVAASGLVAPAALADTMTTDIDVAAGIQNTGGNFTVTDCGKSPFGASVELKYPGGRHFGAGVPVQASSVAGAPSGLEGPGQASPRCS